MSAKHFFLPRFTALMLLLFSIAARSDELTELIITGGVLVENQTWDVPGRTYIIDNLSEPLTIPFGKMLTIGAGVRVATLYNNKSTFVVQGTLNASDAAFDLKTRDGVPQPIIVESSGQASFTICDVLIDAGGAASTTTAVFLARGAATLYISGSSIEHAEASINTVNRAVWSQGTASLIVSAAGAVRTQITDFPEAVYCESTTQAQLAGTDFSEGTYGVVLNNAAVDLLVDDCSFLNYERALQIPAGKQFTLTNININQTGTISNQVGVYTVTYTGMTISGTIANQNIGIHASGDHAGQDVSAVTFTSCNWDLLAEQNYTFPSNKITTEITLPVGHYHIANNPAVTIEAGGKLILQPGTILDAQYHYADMFVVKGTLEATGVRFEDNQYASNSLISATGSGLVKVTDCEFFFAHHANSTDDYWTGSAVTATENATLEINGCLFQSLPGAGTRMQRAVAASGSAKVTIGTIDGTPEGQRTRFVNCNRTIVHTSAVDLKINGADFEGCNVAIAANTIGNLFLSRMRISGGGSGLVLTDAGVLVTDSIEFVNTLDALVLSWAQILNPQISTTGMGFDENSYVKLPPAYTVSGNLTMRALPYRLQTTESNFVTVPAGSKLVFPPGSRVLNENGAKAFHVEGEFRASESVFRFTVHYEHNSFIRFLNNATGSFTQCDFFGGDHYYVNTGGNFLHLSGTSNVLVSGCSFNGNDGGGAWKVVSMGVRIKDNAQARFESYGGRSCSFANFTDAGIYATSINNFPFVSLDSSFNNCASGARLNVATGAKVTLAEDKTITCPQLSISGGGSTFAIIVPDGRTLTFAPGCHLKTSSYVDGDGWFEVAGTARCDNLDADVELDGSRPLFYLRNQGRLELTNSRMAINKGGYYSDSSTRLVTLNDNSTLILDNTSIVTTTSRGGYRAYYAIVNYSPNATILVPGARGNSHLEGFRQAAIFSYGLQPLAGEPALSFASNARDLEIRGGHALSSNLTLPGNIRLEFIPDYGVTTIEAGARLTLGNGTIIDNQNSSTLDPQATFLVKGEMIAAQSRFILRGYYNDVSSTGATDGSDIFRLTDNGSARFNACQFDIYSSNESHYTPWRCRGFAVEGNASLILNGCFLQTKFPGRENSPIRSAVRLRENGRLTTGSQLGNGTTFAGFSEALVVDSSATELTLREAIFTRNAIALLVSAIPAQHEISGNSFIGNTTFAVQNTAAAALTCQNNYWGHPAGPLKPENPFGLGDKISGNIVFVPYTAQGVIEVATLGDHSAGQAPNRFAQAGNLADVLLLRFSAGGTTTPTLISRLTARLKSQNGFAADMISNLRLYQDLDGDGELSDRDALLGNGTYSFPGLSLAFTFTEALPFAGEFLLLGDLNGLESGDALSVGLSSNDVILASAQFLGGACIDASHYLNRLMLSGHPAGTFGNAFLASSEQLDRQLLGFSLSPGYTLQNIIVNLSGATGIDNSKISALRLLVDSNHNAREDFGEQWVNASTITLSGGTGTATFIFGTPIASGTSFVLYGDFTRLERNNTITCVVTPASIIAGAGVVTTGSANSSKHTVAAPLMLLDAPFQAVNGLYPAPLLAAVPLLTFAMTPASRSVEGLEFELYDVAGISAADFSNLRIVVDYNQNGQIDSWENTTVGGTGTAAIQAANGTGTLTFNQPFMTAGGDFILVANIANLANDDTFTITLTRNGVTVPVNDLVEGGVSPVRHAVYRPELPEAALQTNWTLGYRSPGGNTVTGCYSPDGERIVVGYSSGTAFLFAADSNTPLQMFHKHFDTVQYAGFSTNVNDDETVVTVTRDGAVYIWNPETGEMENNLFADLLVRYAVPSPDASKLFIVTEGKGLLLDLTTGDTLWEFVRGTSGITAQLNVADYDPTGEYILVGSADKYAYLLRASSGEIVRTLSGHSQQVTGANFAANGSVLLTSSTDATISLWRMGVADPVSTVTLGGESCLGTGISKDGTRFAVVTSRDGIRYLRMYQDNGNLLWATTLSYKHFTGNFSSLRFDPSGSKLLLCSQANGDINLPAALAVQLSALDGSLIDFVGSRGRVRGGNRTLDFQRVRVSEDGNRIFYMHTEGLDVIFPEFGQQIIGYSDLDSEYSYDITPDGRKLAFIYHNGYNTYTLRYLTVDQEEKRFSLLSQTTFDYPLYNPHNPLTLSRSGGLTIIGDSIRRTFAGSLYLNGPNPDGVYVSAFNADETSWGIAFFTDMAIKTSRLDDMSGSLEKGVTQTKPYKPVKILYHPDGKRVGCVDEYAGVQFYDLDDGTPVGLYDYRSDSSRPRLHDAALSHDGTMLAVARSNSVKLYDMQTGRVLRYFYPTHSGQGSCYAWAVGFGARDNMLWIAWDDSYVEIFQRSRVTGLRLSPATRTLAAGRGQEYTVKALYDDGSSVDVTPSFVYRATGVELAPGARLYVTPAAGATIEAGKVTVNTGAQGILNLEAVYTEGGYTVTANATLTVGSSSLVALQANPAEVSLVPGVLTPIAYTAEFSDGYTEKVTGDVVLSTPTPEYLRITGNNIMVLPDAPAGEIQVTGTYTSAGVTKTATTTIFVHGAAARWTRTAVIPGGDVGAMVYSPNGQQLAVGYPSSAVGLYQVGVTPTQYTLNGVLAAHQRPVSALFWRSNTQLVTLGRDGRLCQWVFNPATTAFDLSAEYQHDAVFTAAGLTSGLLVLGDNLGAVTLFDLDANQVTWTQVKHAGEVTTVAINASKVLCGGEDRRLLLLNRSNGNEEMTWTAFAKPPVAAFFQGTQTVVLSGDKRLARWDTGTEATSLVEFYFPYQPTALTLPSDGSMLVATANNGGNAVWAYNSGGLLTHWLDIPPAQGSITALAVTPDGKHILTGRGTAIVTIETDMGTENKTSDFHSCQFWDRNRGSYAGSLGHSYSLNDARMNADGSLIFTQSARRIYRWDIAEQGVIAETKFLETGYFTPYDFANLELNSGLGEDGLALLGTRVQSSIYLMHPAERLLHQSVHTNASRFGISPDGHRLITNSSEPLTRFWNIALDFPTVTAEHPSTTSDVAFLDNARSLGAIGADLFVRIYNAAGVGISGIPIQKPGEEPAEPEFGSLEGPELNNLEVSANGQRVAVALQYIAKDMLDMITVHTFVQVYDLSGAEPTRVFDTFLGTVEGMVPPVALALSNDGSLLFYGSSQKDGEGHLFDLSKGNELRLFLSPSSGTLSCLGPAGAQFTADGTALMIAWTEGFAEVYARESLDELRLSPAERSVAAGETLDVSAWICYSDGSESDVTARTAFSVNPPAAANIDPDGRVTIAAGLPLNTTIVITGEYSELGTSKTGTSTLRVREATFTCMSIDPPKISLARGQHVDVLVFAHFASTQVEDVSTAPGLVWTQSPTGVLQRSGNSFTVPAKAQYGDVSISARLLRDGDEREVTMRVHIRQEGSMVNPGDFDESLLVDFNDLAWFIGHYGETSSSPTWDSRCDFDGNNSIDLADAASFVGLYGTSYVPSRSGSALLTRSDPGMAQVWLEGPAAPVQVGEVFELKIFAQENDPLARGFRGGPVTLLFDPERVAWHGEFSPEAILAAPYQLFQDGKLHSDRIEQLCGMTVRDGFGNGEPVLYARLTFKALRSGELPFSLAPSSTGMILTPPVGKLVLTATAFAGASVRSLDADGSEEHAAGTLLNGWNLVGVPLIPRAENPWTAEDGSPLPELKFFGYDPLARAYALTAPEEVQPGQAYWVFLQDASLKLFLHGSQPENLPALSIGWNLCCPWLLPQDSQPLFIWNPGNARFAPARNVLRNTQRPGWFYQNQE